MATRSDKLNRLIIRSACNASWEEMQGESGRRFCASCEKEVFDFAQMTPREIKARLEASRGRLCARLTREGGRLATLPPPEVASLLPARAPRRASSLAASVLGALLGAGSAEARSPSPPAEVSRPLQEGSDPGAAGDRSAASHPASTVAAALHGRINREGGAPLAGAAVFAQNALDGRQHSTSTRDDGTFAFDGLPAGIYDLTGELDGFDIGAQWGMALQPGEDRPVALAASESRGETTMGILTFAADPLRKVFDDSELVVVARVGPSTVLERNGDTAEVATELTIEVALKGRVSGHRIAYRHSVYLAKNGTAEEPAEGLAPGVRILAFLQASESADGPARFPAFESADSASGIRTLGEAERDAWVARLESLARLEVRAERRGESEPEELMEWLVATAEEPLTRAEALGEIEDALGALAERAAEEGKSAELAGQDLLAVLARFRAAGGRASVEPRPELLAASLTESQKGRLTAALAKTERLDDGDLALFRVVRGWNEGAAMAWLAHQLRTVKPRADDVEEIWRMESLAESLGNETLTALAEDASRREQEIDKLWPEDSSEAAERLRQKERVALRAELRRQFAEALAGGR